MTLALFAAPLAAQAKSSQTTTSGSAAAASGTSTAPIDESKIPLGQVPSANGTTTQPPAAAVSVWDFLRMALILVAVIVVIYLIFWVIRRGVGKKIPENDLIHVLGSKSIASNRSITSWRWARASTWSDHQRAASSS